MKALPTKYKPLLVCLAFLSSEVQAQAPDSYAGYYAGLEIGTVSYNTQITFDGVDDPAGRGGGGHGAFVGYNRMDKNILVGGELFCNWVKEPDPYTFDPAVTGFSELDLKRSANIGLEVKGGFFPLDWLLCYGSLGYARTKQSVLIDGVALEQFSGGSDPVTFGSLLLGFGLEVAIGTSFSIRTSFETVKGHDLNRTDFGTVANAGLQRFDVEPRVNQFMIGAVYHI